MLERDAVFTFRSLDEAERFRGKLMERLERFGISLNEEKTKVLRCGQAAAATYARQGRKLPMFTFLGFLHVWGKAWNRKQGKHFWRIKRRTCPIRYRKKLSEIKSYIKSHRHEKTLRTYSLVLQYGISSQEHVN